MDNPFMLNRSVPDPILISSSDGQEITWKFIFDDPVENFSLVFYNGKLFESQEKCCEFIQDCIRKIRILDQGLIDDVIREKDNDVRQALGAFLVLMAKMGQYFPEIAVTSEQDNVENKDTLEE